MDFLEGLWGLGSVIQYWNSFVSTFGRTAAVLLFVVLPIAVPIAVVAYIAFF